uniref:Secreted protein n=1 Tax=Cacopsylla melanoneura TaxID=428564 RepID=A0A8D8Y5W2_9HEMI
MYWPLLLSLALGLECVSAGFVKTVLCSSHLVLHSILFRFKVYQMKLTCKNSSLLHRSFRYIFSPVIFDESSFVLFNDKSGGRNFDKINWDLQWSKNPFLRDIFL